MTLVAQRVADGRVLTLIERMLTAGAMDKGRLFPTTQGTPGPYSEASPQPLVMHVKEAFSGSMRPSRR